MRPLTLTGNPSRSPRTPTRVPNSPAPASIAARPTNSAHVAHASDPVSAGPSPVPRCRWRSAGRGQWWRCRADVAVGAPRRSDPAPQSRWRSYDPAFTAVPACGPVPHSGTLTAREAFDVERAVRRTCVRGAPLPRQRPGGRVRGGGTVAPAQEHRVAPALDAQRAGRRRSARCRRRLPHRRPAGRAGGGRPTRPQPRRHRPAAPRAAQGGARRGHRALGARRSRRPLPRPRRGRPSGPGARLDGRAAAGPPRVVRVRAARRRHRPRCSTSSSPARCHGRPPRR